MHIALVIPDLKGGGAQKMMINLANEFASRDYNVDLVLFNSSGIYQDLIHAQVNIVDFDKERTSQAIFNLKNYIKNEKPDVILSALYHVNVATIIARLLSRHKKSRLIVSERNHLTRRLSEMRLFKKLYLKSAVKIFYPMSDKIIAISKGVRFDLVKFLRPKKLDFIETVYNPVITPDFEDKIKEDADNIYPINAGLKLIASGRMVVQKDYPTLFKALALYNKKYGNAHLAILGEGVLQKDLDSLANELKIKDKITYLGFKDNPLAYMKQADMFVCSSAWEGFCNVIVEALYCGLKIVSTDCPSGPSEILEQGDHGGLVDVGDYEDFAERIDDIAKEKYPAEDQKNRAMDFTVQKKADEFEEIFKGLVA